MNDAVRDGQIVGEEQSEEFRPRSVSLKASLTGTIVLKPEL